MNRAIAIIAVVLIAALIIAFVQQDTSKGEKEPVKIGATLALTGSLSYIGENEHNGLKMAVDEINSIGGINGRKIGLVVEDNKGNVNDAVSGVMKMMEIDNATIIISAFTHITTGIAPIISDERILIYQSTVRNIAESDSRIFRDYWDARDSGMKLSNYMLLGNITRVSYLGEISDSCNDFLDGFTSSFMQKGSVVAAEKFNPGETDFRTTILKINEKDPEAFVLCTWRNENHFMPQLKELGLINEPTFHIVAPFLPQSTTPEINELFKENKAVSTWYGFSEGSDNAKVREFADSYRKLYGTEPRPDAAFMYDDIFVLSKALAACDLEDKINDRECISQELLKTNYSGVAGTLTFDEKGVSKRPTILIQNADGKWVEVR